MIRWFARHWFALALAALFCLGLPGLVLFALNLVGAQAAVNEYLEQRFSLIHQMPIPPGAALALFLVPFVILLLYFLKLKRKPIQVSSTFLWKKSIEDLHVNSLLQWLRRNVLLLLQLLAVLALMYAMLSPRIHGRTTSGKPYILMIDNSASMSAVDVKPSRLHRAKEQALREIDAAGEGDAGMVIVFNSSAEIRQSFTTNKQLLRQAVEAIEPSQRPTRIEEALALADSLANPSRSTEDVAARPADAPPGQERTYVPTEGIPTDVHIFSDGRFPDVPSFAVGNLDIQLHPAGLPNADDVNNIAVVDFNAVRDEIDPSRLQVFARLLNFRATPATVTFRVQLAVDGRLDRVYAKEATLPARLADPLPEQEDAPPPKDVPGEGVLTFEMTELDERSEIVVHGRLVDLDDDLAVDDQAWLVIGVVRKARIAWAGPLSAVLAAFFDDDSTRAVAEVTRIRPDELTDRQKFLEPSRNGDFDLIVFDRCAPAREDEMPRGNTLFIGHPPPPWKPPGQPQPDGKTVELIRQPAVKGWIGQSGLLRYLTGLHEIGIHEGFRMNGLPPRTPKFMEGDGDLGLLVALSRGPYTDAVLTFPILNADGEWNTNWPLLPSFPLFLRNVLYSLGNIRDAAGEENTRPGEVKVLRPDSSVRELTVVSPGGRSTPLARGSRPDFAYGETDAVGLYTVNWTGGGRMFAVNLLDAAESNIQPRMRAAFGAETVAAGTSRKQPRELWKWLVAAAVLILTIEWWVYNRRVSI